MNSDTLLRHWRGHNDRDKGDPPQSSVTQVRRANQQAAAAAAVTAAAAQAQSNQDQNGQQHGQQPVQQQPLPAFHPYQMYPPLDGQGYGQQNVADRHTEAASVLLSLPQSHPSFPSNNQDGQNEAPQGYDQAGLSFQSGGGQEDSQHILSGYNEDALDPMLAMTAQEGEATMNAQNEQNHYQSPHNVDHHSFSQADFITDYAVFDSNFQGRIVPGSTLLEEILALFKSDASHANGKITGMNVGDSDRFQRDVAWYGRDDYEGVAYRIPMPSPAVDVELVNNCISKFFSTSSQVFPMIHAPTFRAEEKALLIKAIVTVGAMNFSDDLIAEHGKKMFGHLQASIDTASKADTAAKADLQVVQTALLTGVFGLLSGFSPNIAQVESGHADLARWAADLAQIEDQQLPARGSNPPNGEELDHIWHNWVRKEEQIRALHGLRILDAELASIFKRKPSITIDLDSIPQMAPEALFQAWTSQEWLILLRTSNNNYLGCSPKQLEKSESFYDQATTRLSVVSQLEQIGAAIQSARVDGLLNETKVQEFSRTLINFYERHLSQHPVPEGNDPLQLHILWHTTFLTVLVDYHMFEEALGKYGDEVALSKNAEAHQWANSEVALRCLTHAILIDHFVRKMTVSGQRPIYLARCFYIPALLALACWEFDGSIAQGHQGPQSEELEMVTRNMSLPATPRATSGGELLRFNLIDLVPFAGVPLGLNFFHILSTFVFGPKYHPKASANVTDKEMVDAV